MDVDATVSNALGGAGPLILAPPGDGYSWLYLSGPADNTYSGGTRVFAFRAGTRGPKRVFGTGNVAVQFAGRLKLDDPGNLAAGASVRLDNVKLSPFAYVPGMLYVAKDALATR
jgi:hypothetical protein